MLCFSINCTGEQGWDSIGVGSTVDNKSLKLGPAPFIINIFFYYQDVTTRLSIIYLESATAKLRQQLARLSLVLRLCLTLLLFTLITKHATGKESTSSVANEVVAAYSLGPEATLTVFLQIACICFISASSSAEAIRWHRLQPLSGGHRIRLGRAAGEAARLAASNGLSKPTNYRAEAQISLVSGGIEDSTGVPRVLYLCIIISARRHVTSQSRYTSRWVQMAWSEKRGPISTVQISAPWRRGPAKSAKSCN
ncbi:hypothetical protein A9K55_002894 [Cordyceps militaris]|uniref:Uncharacterized protein n=1 Tax=Cordyceps militaris TaxID=73501 RepID=A0A2H4S858_CORMI|nr:hypothetical protein A9K55_002894 [Cordyceps militaris]